MTRLTPAFFCFLLSLLLVSCVAPAQATVVKGTLSSDSGFKFVGKFCFNTGPNNQTASGNIDISLSVPVDSPLLVAASHTMVVFYDDQADSWPTVAGTCAEKVARAKFVLPVDWKANDDGSGSFTYFQQLTQETRPRFWFVTVANCDEPDGFSDISYRVHFTQALEGSWNKEFGANEKGLNSIYLSFFFLYVLLFSIHVYSALQLRKTMEYVHPLVRLFSIILFLELISVFFYLLHYGIYANDGIGISILARVAEILDVLSRILFILMLILLSRGWTISVDSAPNKVLTLCIITCYATVQILIIIWKYAAQDPEKTRPSTAVEAMIIVLNVIWLCFACFFIYQVVKSYRKESEPSRKSFYLKLAIFYIPWFCAPPLASFAVFALDDWVREKIVTALTVSITAIAYCVMQFFLWHSRAEQYFLLQTPDVSHTFGDYAKL